ncbi:MAG: hypothetical protein H6724_00140 [Sandaracinus sp.]|nr:hypothetical protein [Sandaracinus sp.]
MLTVAEGTLSRQFVVVGDSELSDDIRIRLEESCIAQVAGRAAAVTSRMADARPLGRTSNAMAVSLCLGHEWMNLAIATNSTDFFADGSFATREPLDPNETPTQQLERLTSGREALELVLPAPSTESAATFAYLAVESFQDAALTGAEILELAPAGSLEAEVRAAAADGSGLSDDPSETTRLADVVVVQTAEATQRMVEAARLASELTSNVAQSVNGSAEGDRHQRRLLSWTGRHNSRLETLGLWAGRPNCDCCDDPNSCWSEGIDPSMCFDDSYCARPDDLPPPRTDDCSCCAVDPLTCVTPSMCDPTFDICRPDDEPEDEPRDPTDDPGDFTCDPRSTDEEQAEQVVIALGVLPDAVTPPAEMLDALAAAVREADPDVEAASSREVLETRYRLPAGAFVRAIRNLHQRIQVLGLPIARREVDGRRVVRGLSTRPTPEQLATYTAARTIGNNVFDYQDALASEASYRVPGSSGPAFNHSFVPFAYGRQGVLPALTVVAASLRKALQRSELTPDSVVAGRREVGTRQVAHTAMSFARQMVPQLLKLNVGFGNGNGAERFQLRCFGCEGDTSDYEIFVGETGLHCATSGEVAGARCESREHRVDVTPTRQVEASQNGFSNSFVDFFVTAANVPAHGLRSGRMGDTHFYLTRMVQGRREVLAGFTPRPGPNAVGFTRTTYLPVTAQGAQVATSAALPAPEECDEPELCCDDLPCNPPLLPREAELTEDRYGENAFESIDEALAKLADELANLADNFGTDVIQRQLSADEGAHGARDALEQLCGGVVNVEGLGPAQCETDLDCGDGGDCDGSTCFYEDLADELRQRAGSEDITSVMTCIAGENANINFGVDPMCYFQFEELPPCVCAPADEENCPACPIQVPFGECDATAFGLGAGYTADTTQALGFVAAPPTPEPPDCRDLAIVRNGATQSERLAAVQRLLASDWLSGHAFNAVGERVGYVPQLYQTARATLDGRSWFQTGTEVSGITPSDTFPCAQSRLVVPGLDEDGDPEEDLCGTSRNYGAPLMCGIGSEYSVLPSCENTRNRIVFNSRVYHAARMAAALGAASGKYLYAAGFSGSDGDLPGINFDYGIDYWNESTVDDIVNTAPWRQTSPAGDATGRVEVTRLLDTIVMRRCQQDEDEICSDAAALPNPIRVEGVLPDWLGLTVGGEPVTGLVAGFVAVGGGKALGGTFNGSAAEYEEFRAFQTSHRGISTRCVRIDPGTYDATEADEESEAALAVGAICPTMMTALPGSFDVLGVSRTDAEVIANFWSRREVPTGEMSIAEFLTFVATQNPSNARWLPVPNLTLQEMRDATDVQDGEVPYGRVLDGLELACMAHAEDELVGCGVDVSAIPEINSPEDIANLGRVLDCVADTLENTIGRLTLFDVPRLVAEDLEDGDATTTYPRLRGEYGIAASQLRAGAETINVALNQIASAIRQLGTDMRTAQQQIRLIGLSEELETVHYQMEQVRRGAELAQGLSNTILGVLQVKGSTESLYEGIQRIVTGVSEAAAAITEIALAAKAHRIQAEMSATEETLALLDLEQQYGAHLDAMAGAASLVVQGFGEMQQALTRLSATRQQARSAAMVVLGRTVDSATGRENNFLQAQRRWTDRWVARYHGAWSRARRLAWYARHALEARIGLDLSEIDQDLALVEAPRRWVDSLCDMKPLDYDELRDLAPAPEPVNEVTNGFLGDYMRLLRLVKDSYGFDFAYQDEQDVTVLSLRDEVFDEVMSCDVEGYNLLYRAADPSFLVEAGVEGFSPVFDEDGYVLSTLPTASTPFAEVALSDGTTLSRALGGATAQQLSYVAPLGEVSPAALQPTLSQTLVLDAGRYVLSWSERIADGDAEICMGATPPAQTRLVALLTPSELVPGPDVLVAEEYVDDGVAHPCWRRVRVVFELGSSGALSVGFTLRELPMGGALPSAEWAAPQLEAVYVGEDPTTQMPQAFFPTDDDLAFRIGLCEDHTGGALRQHFTYQCEPICPPEFGDCDAGDYCYWESNFTVSPDSFLTHENGFGNVAARGYNHRMVSVALNLVGTNVRDCERSPRPSVCYASGYLPYSLRADGGRFWNHFGDEIVPPYQPANVEFAKALSAERYITNPLSSADDTLLREYWRHSVHGYPLAAQYRLRIIDVPELDWNAVSDVQLVMRTRYWTHQR